METVSASQESKQSSSQLQSSGSQRSINQPRSLPDQHTGSRSQLATSFTADENDLDSGSSPEQSDSPQEEQHQQAQEEQQQVQEEEQQYDFTDVKITIVQWLQKVLESSNIVLVSGDMDPSEYGNVGLYDLLKTGTMMCQALNNIMQANPSFVQQNLPLIEINPKTDMFASLSNLSSFVRTCELYFNVDRVRLLDPIQVMKNKDERPFIETLYYVKSVVEQLGSDFVVHSAKPYVSMTFDQLSTLISMVTQKPSNPVVAFDPRVVMSVQDTEVFGKLVAKIESIDSSHKTLALLTSTIGSKFESIENDQREIRNKLEGLIEGVLGAFDDVSSKLANLKQVTDLVGTSAMGLHQIVQMLESKNDQTNASVLEAMKLQQVAYYQQQQLLQQQQSVAVSQLKSVAEQSEEPKNLEILTRARSDSNKSAQSAKNSITSGSYSASVPVTQAPAISQSAPTSPITKAPLQKTPSMNTSTFKVFKLPDEVLAKNLPKEEVMRQSVIYEVIDSEADYVRDVNVMLEFHYKQIKMRNLLDATQLKTMFSNLEELLPPNQELLANIVTRRDENPVIDGIGDLLLDICPKFMVYDEYCSNYPTASLLYKEIRNREDFKAYLDKTMNSPECRGLSLESFLIKPVQRICKYPLLLRELIKNTPQGNKDRTLLEQAMVQIEQVVTSINEKTRLVGERDKLIELQSKVDNQPPLQLVSPGRRIVKEGQIQRIISGKPKDRFVVLLSDVILVLKQGSNKVRYQIESVFDLYKTQLVSESKIITASGPNAVKQAKLTFELLFESESYIFQCLNEIDKGKWVQMAEDQIKFVKSDPSQGHGPAKIYATGDNAAPARTERVSSPTVPNFLSNPIASLKKSNTMSMKKRSNIFGKGPSRKSNESLHEDEQPQPPQPDKQPNQAQGVISSGHVSQLAQVFSTSESTETPTSKRQSVSAEKQDGLPPLPSSSNNALASTGDVAQQPAEQAQQDPAVIEIPGFPQWRAVDAGNGQVYYFNTDTNETSWYHPGMVAMAAQYSQMAPAADPAPQ